MSPLNFVVIRYSGISRISNRNEIIISTKTYHYAQSADSLPVGLDAADVAHVVVDVVLPRGWRNGISNVLIPRPLHHHAGKEEENICLFSV